MRLLATALLLVGCGSGPTSHGSNGSNATNATINANANAEGNTGGTEFGPDGGSSTTGNASCGNQTFALTASAVPPNVFLLVDRSGSMSDGFGGNTSGTKWDAAQSALKTMLTDEQGKAEWGLSFFPPNPSADTCGKAEIDVPLMMGDEAAILAKVDALTDQEIGNPRGSTPTADALATVRDSANLSAADRNNYVVLVTDGIPNCNNASDVTATITQLYNRSPSVKTFVVGLGDETASNPDLLNQWAVAGHTDRNDPTTKYYQADDAQDLTTAFSSIIGQTASCTFSLQTTPADPTLVVGSLDGASQTEDPNNGFTYDASSNSVTFHGTDCDEITSGQVTDVGVQYGCPPATIN